jgi:hypothetical protein
MPVSFVSIEGRPCTGDSRRATRTPHGPSAAKRKRHELARPGGPRSGWLGGPQLLQGVTRCGKADAVASPDLADRRMLACVTYGTPDMFSPVQSSGGQWRRG